MTQERNAQLWPKRYKWIPKFKASLNVNVSRKRGNVWVMFSRIEANLFRKHTNYRCSVLRVWLRACSLYLRNFSFLKKCFQFFLFGFYYHNTWRNIHQKQKTGGLGFNLFRRLSLSIICTFNLINPNLHTDNDSS